MNIIVNDERLSQFTFFRLSEKISRGDGLKPFDCGKKDLNNFFYEDALLHEQEYLSVTYLFEDDMYTVAFFTILNDRIDAEIDSSIRQRIIKNLPDRKARYEYYPAVKIGRLGIHRNYQRQGIGGELLLFIERFFKFKNKTGCRFITVDAYARPKGIQKFYEANGFALLINPVKKTRTISMYYEIVPYFTPVGLK